MLADLKGSGKKTHRFVKIGSHKTMRMGLALMGDKNHNRTQDESILGWAPSRCEA